MPDAAADDAAEELAAAVPEPLVLALDVASVEPALVAAVPLACVSLGSTTDEPPAAVVPLAAAVVVAAGALVTVGTEAAGVTWIWPSEYCETGTRVVVAAAAVLVMEAQGVVPTCTWPTAVC